MNRLFLLLFSILMLSACNNKPENSEQSSAAVVENVVAIPDTKSSGEPWTEEQLLESGELARHISSGNKLPVLISLGAGNIIPGSKDTGAAGERAGIENLKKELQTLPKDSEIVLYCGCCPFKICPNVRPAFSLLNEMEFTNHRLLNLPENIKVDWIDKGYAVGN